MLEGGFILLHRSILRWEWYGDLNTARLFIHLLLTVNYEPQRYAAVLADRCQLVTLSPGDAFAACVAQGGDAAGQRAQRDGRQAGAYAQRTEASGTAPGV